MTDTLDEVAEEIEPTEPPSPHALALELHVMIEWFEAVFDSWRMSRTAAGWLVQCETFTGRKGTSRIANAVAPTLIEALREAQRQTRSHADRVRAALAAEAEGKH